jgi:GH35 family endo-1,4-beta-xylanase
MRHRFQTRILGAILAFLAGQQALGQTINGNALSFRSNGSSAGSDWVLNENGYVGTFFTLDAPGSVTFRVNASGSTTDGVAPRMNVVVGDARMGFDVASGFTGYQSMTNLPAGTYFVRTEFENDVPTANRQLTVRSLQISGATSVSNTTSVATNNASALAAADSYIENFRRGPANVSILGALPGDQVQVKMARNAFNFGTMVTGFSANALLGTVSPGDTTSTQARYQNFINNNFNILVPSNMGKWQPNENTQNVPTMGNVDTILNYAQSHKMDVRMHNLAWGAQQPAWVNTLLTNAQSSDPVVAAQAKTSLMTAIDNRIKYYVGDGDANVNDGDRSRKYSELDVVNEILREGTYWDIFGAEGIAQIYKKTQDAVAAAGADTKLYTNEYHIFNYANDPGTGASDNYANWYRRNIEAINNAGYGEVVTGIGIQYISEPRTTSGQTHSPARIHQAMQNLSVLGLPITLTEFSVPPESGGVITTEERAAEILGDSLRLMYGSANATSMLIWEPYPTIATDATNLFDDNWNLRASGERLVELMDQWTTPTQSLAVGPDGSIDFTGYYGEYQVTIGNRVFQLDLTKGTTDYNFVYRVPGDFDGDLDVDAGDLERWKLGFGVDARGDADFDGDTDSGDFLVWQRNLGQDYSPNMSAVPEPGTSIMLAVAVGGAISAGKRTPRGRRR